MSHILFLTCGFGKTIICWKLYSNVDTLLNFKLLLSAGMYVFIYDFLLLNLEYISGLYYIFDTVRYCRAQLGIFKQFAIKQKYFAIILLEQLYK